MRGWTVGVDFGGTNIKVGLVDARHHVIADTSLPTAQHRTPPQFVRGIRAAVDGLRQAADKGRGRVRGIGVGAPGLVDAERGVIHELVNVPGGWRGVRLASLVAREMRCPCVVDNDVNVIALGEWQAGAGRGTRDSVYVTLGTGVGGGLVVNGQLVRGAAGSAGEIGHMLMQPSGPRCGCGRRGCLEALTGTAAILRAARAAIRRAPNGRLAQLARRNAPLTPALISRAAAEGDRTALAIWSQIGQTLGDAFGSLINLLSPERIVVGGGISGAWPHLIRPMRQAIQQRAFAVPARRCRVVRAQLGHRAGILGASFLIHQAAR